MLFHDPLYVCAELVDLLADATPGLAHANADLARELAAAAKSLMLSVTRMRFAGGQRREALRRRARAQAEQVLALVHVVDAHRCPQPFPGHRDELMARAWHLIRLLDRARQPYRRPEP
jgi:hypothetical protein